LALVLLFASACSGHARDRTTVPVVVGGADSITAAPPSLGMPRLRETPETRRMEQALRHPYGGAPPAPTIVQMSEDRRHLAVVYENGEVTVWDLASPRMVFRHRYDNLGSDTSPANTVVALADDGRFLATSQVWPAAAAPGWGPDVVNLTDLSTGSDLPVSLPVDTANRPPIPSMVQALDFAPDHRLLITTSRHAEELAVFDPATDRLTNLAKGRDLGMDEGRYAPDGRTIVGATNTSMTVWPSGQIPRISQRQCLPPGVDGYIHLPPGGRTIHCVSRIEATIWDAMSARRIADLHSRYEFSDDVIDLPRGGYASFSQASGMGGDVLEIFAADGKPLAQQPISPSLTHGLSVRAAAYADPGLAIVIVGPSANAPSEIRVLQLK
jgi:WD40 repeat protein